jgi:hypothetical protein
MKKLLLILTVFVGSFSVAKAQDDIPADGAKRQEKIEALYIAFVTEKLQLTPDEAQKFWPLHTQFRNEIKALKPDMPVLDRDQAVLNIKKRYQDRFNGILGTQRCERFYNLEGEFKQKLLERFKNRQNNGNGRPKMGGRP